MFERFDLSELQGRAFKHPRRMTSRGVTLRGLLFFTYVSLYGLSSVGAQLPENITFQVFVAFDNVLHNEFKTPYEAQKYAVVFFNAVNLIFREMTNPRIQFEVVMFHSQMVPFTSKALVLEDNEVNATASLPKAAMYTSTLPQFKLSDIIFIMSGRKVFSKGNYRNDYLPQGLTWEKGICNSSKRVVIVSDIGKRFEALPNAGFQLARLLGAPTACTWDYHQLSGHSWLFKLNDCHKKAIREHLKNLDEKDHQGAQQCFAKSYKTSMSSLIKDLPSSLVSAEQICEADKGDVWSQYYDKFVCVEDHFFVTPTNARHERILRSQTGGCLFHCCYNDNFLWRLDYQVPTYYSLDGSRCNIKNGICAVGQCVTDYKP